MYPPYFKVMPTVHDKTINLDFAGTPETINAYVIRDFNETVISD